MYASNRGDDNIAVFSVNDVKQGTLNAGAAYSPGGQNAAAI